MGTTCGKEAISRTHMPIDLTEPRDLGERAAQEIGRALVGILTVLQGFSQLMPLPFWSV
jgi:hypothetical protein